MASRSELLARLNYALKSADETISTSLNIEDQGQVIVMRINGSIVRIPTQSEGLEFLRDVIEGLIKANREE